MADRNAPGLADPPGLAPRFSKRPCRIMLPAMSQPAFDDEAETDAARRQRLAWEADRIAEADADVSAGRLVSSAKVKARIDSIGTDGELPVPYSGR